VGHWPAGDGQAWIAAPGGSDSVRRFLGGFRLLGRYVHVPPGRELEFLPWQPVEPRCNRDGDGHCCPWPRSVLAGRPPVRAPQNYHTSLDDLTEIVAPAPGVFTFLALQAFDWRLVSFVVPPVLTFRPTGMFNCP
jgi:hypothetical protein